MTKIKQKNIEDFVHSQFSTLLSDFRENFRLSPPSHQYQHFCSRSTLGQCENDLEHAAKLHDVFDVPAPEKKVKATFSSLFEQQRCGHVNDCRYGLFDDKLLLRYIDVFQLSLTPQVVQRAYAHAAVTINIPGVDVLQKISGIAIGTRARKILQITVDQKYKALNFGEGATYESDDPVRRLRELISTTNIHPLQEVISQWHAKIADRPVDEDGNWDMKVRIYQLCGIVSETKVPLADAQLKRAFELVYRCSNPQRVEELQQQLVQTTGKFYTCQQINEGA